MEREFGVEVRPDYDSDIHEAKRIGSHFGLTLPQRARHPASRLIVAPARQYAGALAALGVADDHHVEAAGTEQPGNIDCEPIPVGAVQYLYLDAVTQPGHWPRELPGPRRRNCALGPAPTGHQHQRSHRHGGEGRGCANQETSAFQKRTVGSRRAQPDDTV